MRDHSIVTLRSGINWDHITLTSGQGVRVHSSSNCVNKDYCAVHSPSDHALVTCPLFWRQDRGIFERICGHGVGHPDPDSIRYEKSIGGIKHASTMATHGDSCSCCEGAYKFLRESENVEDGYITKDSGKRVEFDSGMVRDTDEGKPRFDLLRPLGVPYKHQMLTRFAELMARGAKKYTSRNWEQASGQEELDRMKGSALRHAEQWFHGETDEDHAAAVFFNITAYEATKYKMENQ